jgi:serine/threonine protein kinase
MKAEQYQQVKQVFNRALGLSPDERPAFLDQAVGDQPALRSAVEKLLAAHDCADSFIETPAFEFAAEWLIPEASALVEGERIGPYRMVREIGRGGMGAVYLAERADDQYRKQVAIKLVRRGLDTAEILRRFLAERQILANLDHPNIARLLDGSTTEDGLPYIAMEYVEGLPLVDYCDRHALAITERLKLFRTVCSAVHYAHQNLVIHRDLKPGNILVTTDGVPKLLDFGIAKVFRAEAQDGDATRTELRALTPEYASPEQLRGERVTTASDVYSLGVILYQLLTGLRPYQFKTADPMERLRTICDQQPEKPSAAVEARMKNESRKAKAARFHPASPGLHPAALRGDLDNIVLMAMRKEPQRRYSSVEQFADDLRRHLENLPVLARKDTFAYRAAKLIRRNKAVAAAIGWRPSNHASPQSNATARAWNRPKRSALMPSCSRCSPRPIRAGMRPAKASAAT